VDFQETAYSKYQHLYWGKEKKEFWEAVILNEGL
jgi:hypothetical protein